MWQRFLRQRVGDVIRVTSLTERIAVFFAEFFKIIQVIIVKVFKYVNMTDLFMS